MIECIGPETLIAAQPFERLFHRRGGQPARDRAPRLGPRDEPGVRQHVQMFHHGRQRHRERFREFRHGALAAIGQTREQRAPRRVGERGERAVEGGILKLNHEVKHMTRGCFVKEGFGNRLSAAAVFPVRVRAGFRWVSGSTRPPQSCSRDQIAQPPR